MDSRRILIIDDEAPLRYLLERQLCRAGYGVLEAVDGFAGVSAALADTPDLIILDLMMPGIDGFETFRRLRSDLRTAEIPVVFLSGSVSGEMRRRAFAMGAADVLAKPHDINDVATVVAGILRRQIALSEPPARGRIVSLFGLAAGNASATMGIQLSRMVALHTTWPVVLIDLDLARSPLGSRFGLRGSPHILDMLHHPAVPMTVAEVAPYIQPQHSGLGIIVAPSEMDEIDAASSPRLRAALDELRALGYYVVIHLGHELTDLALSAMRGSDLVCALAPQNEMQAYEAFAATVVVRGVAASKLAPVAGDMLETNKARASQNTGAARLTMRRQVHVPSGQRQALDLFL